MEEGETDMDTDKAIQEARRNLIISSIILCITGLIFMLFSGTVVKLFGWILGAILCVLGVLQLIRYIRSQQSVGELILGILSLVIGILLFAHPGWFMSALSVIAGIYILIEGGLKIRVSVQAKQQAVRGWWALLIAAIVSIVVGILLIAIPFQMNQAFMIVLGIGLLLNGIENIIHAVYTGKILREMNQDIIDMDDYVN